MRKVILILLTLCLFCGLAIPAYAAGEIDPDVAGQNQQKETEVQEPQEQPLEDKQEPQESPVTVSTLEELQAAIDAAEDGDIIAIKYKILIRNMTLSTDKRVILTRSSDYTSGELVTLQDGGILDGFEFRVTNSGAYTINVVSKVKDSAKLLNCSFNGDETALNSFIYLNSLSKPYIFGCTFVNCYSNAITAGNSANFTLEKCRFTENYYDCIDTYAGKVVIKDCEFSGNICSQGAISTQHGEITIENCHFSGNILKDSDANADFHFSGSVREILKIVDNEAKKAGYYNVATGEKLILPFEGNINADSSFTYLTYCKLK